MRRLAIWMALALALGMGLSGLALAQEPEDTFAMSTRFPVMRGVAGTSFDFDVDLKYEGRQARTFELRAQGPPDWTTTVKASFPDREIPEVRIDANRTYPETIKVSLLPPIFKAPEPGEYTVPLEAKAKSGTLADKLELKAVVTARYGLTMTTGTGRLNTTATAGKDSVLTLFLRNTGTERLDDISLSADKPEDWSIAFKPEKVSVGVGDVVEDYQLYRHCLFLWYRLRHLE